jgi:hypothetical protein
MKSMMHCKELLEYDNRPLIAMNLKFNKFIMALRTSRLTTREVSLRKIQVTIIMDAFRLALKVINLVKKEEEMID